MSRENVTLVRDLLEAFRRRDHERAFRYVRTYWRRWLSAWKDLRFEVEDVRDGGDEIVALIRNQRQWGRHSGIATDIPPYGIVFSIRDGMIVRWRTYPTRSRL